MRRNEERPGVLREPSSAESKKSDGPFFVSPLARPVNHLVLFRLAAINGIGVVGGWADRLTLWLPMVDMAARMLRELMEARV